MSRSESGVPSPGRRKRAALALGFYLLATLLVAAPVSLHFDDTVVRAVRPDVWLNVWALAWTSEHLFTAPGRLFDANIFFPHEDTLAYSDHFIGEALLAAPVWAVSGSAVAAYNLAWVLALALTAWGGYLWVRCLIGDEPAGEAAALVAGAVCLLVPGKRTALSHLQVISLQGVTLSLFAAHRLLRRPDGRRALGLAAAAVYAALSSWYTAAYTAVLLPLVGLAGLREERARGAGVRRRIAGWGAAALLLAAAAMVPVALPFRAVQGRLDFERPVAELVATSLAPVDFVSSWSWLHAGLLPEGSGAGGYFPGFVALALALVGVRDGLRRGDRWPALYAAAAAAFAVLALGPRAQIMGIEVPLPYALLYALVPGFDALRNPYRAAFVASILLAAPVGYGARRVIEATRARLLRRQRWQLRPRLGALRPATWGIAALLAALHLLEAWPGPQQVAALPRPTSGAYEFLARQPDARALVWPLPRPFDDNARYQLWTVGTWTPLVNGHSGLYPPDFVGLYDTGGAFPEAPFLELVKRDFPVTHVLAHYGLAEGGDAARAAAGRSPQLREVWSQGSDVVYRLANGAAGGWLRRRVPGRMIHDTLRLDLDPSALGCGVRVRLEGVLVAEAPLPTGAPPGESGVAVTVPLTLPAPAPELGIVEVALVAPGRGPRYDLRAALQPAREAVMEINGVVALRGAVVVAVLSRGGDPAWMAAAPADAAGAGTALREALARAGPGDEVLLAVAEALDDRLVERLRLLLDAAGVATTGDTLRELATTYAFRGTVGAPPGSAREAFGEESAGLVEPDARSDCRLAAIHQFEFVAGQAR